jgi:hypothetical protein
MSEQILVYKPTGSAVAETQVAARKASRPWGELRFALVDNSKPGALALLTGIADTLGIPDERRTMVYKQIASRALNDEEKATIQQNCDVALIAVGNCGSCCSWTVHDVATLTKDFGIPSVAIITTPFQAIANQVASSLSYPDLPVIVVEHPVGNLPFEVIHERGAKSAIAVQDALTGATSGIADAASSVTVPADAAASELVAVDADQAAVDEFYISHGWSDGLPVVAPTEARVLAMLGRHAAEADTLIGKVPVAYGAATLRSIAVNAVMAGCLPEYFDVVVAVVKAAVDPVFNLHAIQPTTHPVAPMILVNGPIAERIGINAGTNALGSGNRANATIGRALRLIMHTIGGGVPGETDRATLGTPGKYTFCLAENEARSPWAPYHVSRGFDPSVSTVTLFGVEGPHNMNDPGSVSAAGILKTFIGSMNTTGSNHHEFPRAEPLVLLSPEHAEVLAREGYTRGSLQEFFFENAKIPLDAFSQERIERFLARRRPKWFGPENTTGFAYLADGPEDYQIAVAGGPGTHSVFLPSFGGTVSVTVPIDEA